MTSYSLTSYKVKLRLAFKHVKYCTSRIHSKTISNKTKWWVYKYQQSVSKASVVVFSLSTK